MRKIIFKAKRVDNGEWVEGSLLQTTAVSLKSFIVESSCYTFDKWDWNKCVQVDTDTVCQYTGLTDKNGNKIWENDVVERVDRRNGLYVFREQPKMNCKVVWTDRHGYDTEPSCGYFDKKNALECSVIGNTFDNACIDELLKEE